MIATLPPGSVLFDKGVIRRLYERRVRFALGEPPTLLQVEAANAYSLMSRLGKRLYITEETSNVLRLRPPVFAAAILYATRSLKKGGYLRRWARRLRDFSFSPEDAIVLAHGSFGIDPDISSLGVDLIATTDKKLAARYSEEYARIEKRFNDMVLHLPAIYSVAKLPRVVDTATILSLDANV